MLKTTLFLLPIQTAPAQQRLYENNINKKQNYYPHFYSIEVIIFILLGQATPLTKQTPAHRPAVTSAD